MTIWRNFNRRFTIKPAQPDSAFVKLAGVELALVRKVEVRSSETIQKSKNNKKPNPYYRTCNSGAER
jgi:hypothetical protein